MLFRDLKVLMNLLVQVIIQEKHRQVLSLILRVSGHPIPIQSLHLVIRALQVKSQIQLGSLNPAMIVWVISVQRVPRRNRKQMLYIKACRTKSGVKLEINSLRLTIWFRCFWIWCSTAPWWRCLGWVWWYSWYLSRLEHLKRCVYL